VYLKARWDSGDQGGKEGTSRIFFYVIKADGFTDAKKVILMRQSLVTAAAGTREV